MNITRTHVISNISEPQAIIAAIIICFRKFTLFLNCLNSNMLLTTTIINIIICISHAANPAFPPKTTIRNLVLFKTIQRTVKVCIERYPITVRAYWIENFRSIQLHSGLTPCLFMSKLGIFRAF